MHNVRKRRLWGLLASIGLCAAAASVASPARADSVNMLDLTATVYTSAANTYSFQTPGPGKVWVSLADVGWPEKFQNLTASILSSTSSLGSMHGPGSFDVSVGQAGTLYAYVAGVAGATLGFNVGMYSLHVGFVPAGQPVPLPEALRLLVVGLGLVGTIGLLRARRQTEWTMLSPHAGAMKA